MALTLEEALKVAGQSGTPSHISLDQALAQHGIDESYQVKPTGQMLPPGPALTYASEPEKSGLGYAGDLTGTQEKPAFTPRKLTPAERLAYWTSRTVLKTAPYIVAGETGAALVPKGAPLAARILASSGAQGLYGGLKEGSLRSGLEQGAASLLGEGIFSGLGARSALKKGIQSEVVAGTMERGTAGRAQELFGRVSPKQEADVARGAAQEVKAAASTLSPGRREAEAAIAFRDKLRSGLGLGPAIDTAPIKRAMQDQIKQVAGGSPERQALNEWMQERIDSLPPRMTNEELDAFIQDWSNTIKSTYGKARTDITVPQSARRAFIDPARALRDKMIPEAAEPFAQAERYMSSTNAMRKLLMDSKGNVKESAPGIWRQAMQSDITLQKMRDFEQATGRKVIDEGMSLARKKIWNNRDAQSATSMLRAVFSLRTGMPSGVIAAKVPGKVTKMMLLGSRPLGAKAAQLMAGHAKKGDPETAAPEENFPGMTNIGHEK